MATWNVGGQVMDTVYCSNESCDYGTENDQKGNWAFECPKCGQENLIEQDTERDSCA